MMKNVKLALKSGKWLILALLLSLAIALPVLAADGDGTGGGQDQPLALLSSTPANGQTDVALDASIVLGFSKNVINMTVSENNQQCFSLWAGGQSVAIDVEMADDQIYPEKKREIVVVPSQPLRHGTSYTLKIEPQLTAKSGATLGQEVQVTFKTVAAASQEKPQQQQQNNAVDSVQKQDVAKETQVTTQQKDAAGNEELHDSNENQLASKDEQDVSSDEQAVEKDEQSTVKETTGAAPAENEDGSPVTMIALLGAVVLAGVVYAVVRRRK